MRRILPAIILLAACGDSPAAPASDCNSEMSAVRAAEGPPSRTQRDETGGSFREDWIYTYATQAARTYTFKWGSGYAQCSVTPPKTLAGECYVNGQRVPCK